MNENSDDLNEAIELDKKYEQLKKDLAIRSAQLFNPVHEAQLQKVLKKSHIERDKILDLLNLSKEDKDVLKSITDRNKIIEKLNENGGFLSYLEEKWRDDEEIVIIAVKNIKSSLRGASDRLKNNYNFILGLIKNNIEVWDYVGYELKKEVGSNEPISYLEKKIFHDQLQASIPINIEFDNVKKSKI